MRKNPIKQSHRDIRRAAIIEKTAELTGFSKRYIRYVLDGKRENATVMGVYMEIEEGENLLMEEVKKLVPFIS